MTMPPVFYCSECQVEIAPNEVDVEQITAGETIISYLYSHSYERQIENASDEWYEVIHEVRKVSEAQ